MLKHLRESSSTYAIQTTTTQTWLIVNKVASSLLRYGATRKLFKKRKWALSDSNINRLNVLCLNNRLGITSTRAFLIVTTY